MFLAGHLPLKLDQRLHHFRTLGHARADMLTVKTLRDRPLYPLLQQLSLLTLRMVPPDPLLKIRILPHGVIVIHCGVLFYTGKCLLPVEAET